MSTTRTTICAACGAPAPLPFRAPPTTTSPDLDLRPGEPARATLRRWIATCAGCGAAAPDLAALPDTAAATVETAAYRALEAPAEALPFLRHAMICREAGEWEQAAEAMLHAAWTADDAGDAADATRWRQEAADLWAEPRAIGHALARIDAQRRAGLFDDALASCERLELLRPDEETARIIAFQRARIMEGDGGRHLLSSALRPPARTPHVAHGREKRPGLFRRLLGG